MKNIRIIISDDDTDEVFSIHTFRGDSVKDLNSYAIGSSLSVPGHELGADEEEHTPVLDYSEDLIFATNNRKETTP